MMVYSLFTFVDIMHSIFCIIEVNNIAWSSLIIFVSTLVEPSDMLPLSSCLHCVNNKMVRVLIQYCNYKNWPRHTCEALDEVHWPLYLISSILVKRSVSIPPGPSWCRLHWPLTRRASDSKIWWIRKWIKGKPGNKGWRQQMEGLWHCYTEIKQQKSGR